MRTRPNIVREVDSGLLQCRICGLRFLGGRADEDATHYALHEQIRNGAVPYDVREFMKNAASALLFREERFDAADSSTVDDSSSETAKRVIAFAWWARARQHGIPEDDFDDYMAAHLNLIDALASDDQIAIEFAEIDVARWDQFD